MEGIHGIGFDVNNLEGLRGGDLLHGAFFAPKLRRKKDESILESGAVQQSLQSALDTLARLDQAKPRRWVPFWQPILY